VLAIADIFEAFDRSRIRPYRTQPYRGYQHPVQDGHGRLIDGVLLILFWNRASSAN